MPELPISLDQLRLNDPGVNRGISILLSSLMLFPHKTHEKNRLHYKSLNVLHSVSFLVDECNLSKEEAGGNFINLAEAVFGSWGTFVTYLLSKKMPEEGHGSLQPLAENGFIAGEIFSLIFVQRISLDDAVAYTIKGANELNLLATKAYTEGNLKSNIWPKWKSVAHLWAAASHFEMPEPTRNYIALDKAVLKTNELPLADGLEGLIELAQYYYDTSLAEDLGTKSSSERLTDKKSAWNVFLE